MATLWKCPLCGKGKRAASRLRKDATARFCLDCSATSPTLVERFAPSLEKKREAGKARSKAKAEKKREREAAPYMIGGVDVRKSFERAKKLRCWQRWKVAPRIANVGLSFTRRKDGHTSGRAWEWRQDVHVSAGVDLFDVELAIVHELVHKAHFAKGMHRVAGRKTSAIHDAEFHDMLRVAACEFFGFPGEKVADEYRAAGGAARAYSMDDALRAVRAELDPAGAQAAGAAKEAARKAKRASSKPWTIEREEGGDWWTIEIPGALYEASSLYVVEDCADEYENLIEIVGSKKAGRGRRYTLRARGFRGLKEVADRMFDAWDSPHRAACERLGDDLRDRAGKLLAA